MWAGRGCFVYWGSLEEEFGVVFPADYMGLHDYFGPFSLDESLSILGPGQILQTRAEHREVIRKATRGKSGVYVSNGIGLSYPEIEGEFVDFDNLIRFGSTDVGFSLYWHASSRNPKAWGVLVGDGNQWYAFDMGVAELLVSVLSRDLTCPPLVDEEWPNEDTELIPL